MELELGLKITKTREDVSSSVDFCFSKDPFGPLVLSRETDSRFIIIIHLKGFKQESIEIEINKEGNRITIRGRKPVEEMVLIRWMAWRKEVELKAFKKVFRIPDIVDLDKIKARFDEDDATLTITMPKRVKGISGFKIEEEEEEEERVDFGDVSEAQNREEIQKGEEVEEENVEKEKSEKFETEIQREEERESQVFEGEENGFSGGLDEEETEDENLEKNHQIDEQDNILECIEEEEDTGLQELADSYNKSSLKKLPDIDKEGDSHEHKSHKEQENSQELMEQQVSQAETKSDDIRSRAFEESEEEEEEEPDELDRTSKSRAKEKEMTDDNGLSKVQGIDEPERHYEENKIQEMVEGETVGHEKKQIVKMETKNRDAKEEVDEKMGEGFTPDIDRTQVVGEDDTAETETKPEFESGELEADEVHKIIHELVEKKEEQEENAKARSLTKIQENEEQQFKGQKQQDKQEKRKELVEEKTPEAETNVINDIPKPVQEIKLPEDTLGKTGDEGKKEKEEKKIVKMDIKNGDAKEEVDAKMGDGFAPNIAETETKPEECESDTIKAEEEEKIQKLVEKKVEEEENVKVGTQSEDINLINLQENEEQQFQGQKPHGKQEKINNLVEEKTPEAVTNIAKDTPKPVQERSEGKHKSRKLFEEETKTQPEEYKEKIMETGKKINDAGARKVQEIIRQQELDEPARCEKESKTRELVKGKTNNEEKEFEETESNQQEMVQEITDEKTHFSKDGKIKKEEKIAEKKTESGDDDISRNVGDTEQRDSDVMKGQEEKDKIQDLVMEGKAQDGGKGIIAVAETIAENDKSRKVEEIDEQESHEEETCGNQFQKLKGGEISGRGEAEDVENEKKTTEPEKRVRDSTREAQEIEKNYSDASGNYNKGSTIQELEENRVIYRNEHEEEMENEADKPEKMTGLIEKELVNMNSQLEKDKVDGERTQELVKEKPKDCKEEEARNDKCSEESKTKRDDNVVRKVQGLKEQELYEPKREHVSKIKELVEEKEMAESETNPEYGSLRKVDGSEGQELNEPKIHKERDKPQITGAEEPSGQEKEEEEGKIVESEAITENDNSKDVQEIKEERSDKPESHEKRYKIQEVVETGHDDSKEEQKEEKVVAKTEQETEEDSSKRVQEIEKQEHDELKRSMVQDKIQETEEKDNTTAIEAKEIVERSTKTKDGSLRKVRDDDFPELSKTYKRQEEDKVQELVEMGTGDYREKVRKQEEDDFLRSQEAKRPDLDEFERHSEQRNIPQLVEDDSSGKLHEFEERKSYEERTHEKREKRDKLVKEEATDRKDKHTVGEGHNDHKEVQQEEKVIAKEELKTEKISSKKVQEIEKQENDGLKRSMVRDKMQETEKKDKTRAMEENEIVERRTKTKDGSLRKVREGEDPELGKHKRHEEVDRIHELVETEISDHRGNVKKKYEDEKGEGKMENISEPGGNMEGDRSAKLHVFLKKKSYEDWRQKESEEIKNFVEEEETDPEDKHTGGEVEREEERYDKVAQTKTKVDDEINKKVKENKEPESVKQDRYEKLDKLEGVLEEGANDYKNEENLVEDVAAEIQETEKEESLELERHEKLDIVQDFVEDETGVQEDEEAEEAAAVLAENENGSSRKVQTIEEQELEESEIHKEQNKIPETSDLEVKEEDEQIVSEKEAKEQEAHVLELDRKTENFKEGRRGEKGKQGKTVETMSPERFKTKSDDGNVRKIQETKVKKSNEKKSQEPEGKIEELERKETSNHEVNLVTEDDSLRKCQEFLEKESNVSKRRPVEQETIQELKEMEKRHRVNKEDKKAEAETKIDDGKSRKIEMSKMLKLDESKEKQKKNQKPMEEKSNAPEKEKEGNEKITEQVMRDKIDSRIKDQEIKRQEPYELLKNGEHDKTSEPFVDGTKHHREEEKGMEEKEIEQTERIAEELSSRKVQQVKPQETDELKKHWKPSDDQGEEEINKRGANMVAPKTKSMEDSNQYQNVEERGSDQPERYAAQEKIQELKVEEKGKEENDTREEEQKEKAKRIPQVESKINVDTTGLRGQEKKENHQELVETSDQRKEEKEEEIVGKAETIDEHEEGIKSDKTERHGDEEMREKLAEEETSNDKEGNRAGGVLGEGETKIGDDCFRKVKEIEEQELAITMRHREQGQKQSSVEKDRSGRAKENKNQETKGRDDSSRKTRENEKQESYEQKRNEEQDKKNLGLVGEKTNYFRNEEDVKEDEGIRKLKGIEKREMVEEKMNNEEGEAKRSMTEAEDHGSKGPEGLRKQIKSCEKRLRDNNHKDEEIEKTETKSKDNDSRKFNQIKEQETSEQKRIEEQGRIKEDITHCCREKKNRGTEFKDTSSKKIQEIDKEESIGPGADEKRDKIQEPADKETIEDDEEELEVEFEDEEEEWEAEVIQEKDSDDNIRQIRRIKLGFRLVGGSALFMSLIVIVIRFIHSKRKIKCYKF